jgi:tetratricopeptide (TPR) repeat protein
MLAKSYYSLGIILQAGQRPAEAEKEYQRALAVQQKLADQSPAVPEYQSDLGATLNNLALIFMNRSELGPARQRLEEAIRRQRAALKVDPQHRMYRSHLHRHLWNLVDVLLRTGEYDPAARTALELPQLFPDIVKEYYWVAETLVRCSAQVEKDAKLTTAERRQRAQTYGDQAVTLLRTAVQKGYQTVDQIKADAAFTPLHSRKDFQELLRERTNPARPPG